MNWKAAIDKFEERRLAIWENMPQDVYDLSGGKVPGDTNVYGQYVTTMMYADSELRTLCDEVLFYMIETAKEGDVDLRTLEIVFYVPMPTDCLSSQSYILQACDVKSGFGVLFPCYNVISIHTFYKT